MDYGGVVVLCTDCRIQVDTVLLQVIQFTNMVCRLATREKVQLAVQ